ncbi:MAG: acylphosphatase [Bacteroidota bacterium]|nr:acylphosphatase [Bacteroidota bacterium]
MIHHNIIIKGKVQGVSFRARTKQKAEEIGVTGFVKNEEDGSVYVEVEGDRDQVQAFMEWCGEGPELADVEEVYFETGPVKNFPWFEIKY